jgi:hypothetical protein
MERFEIIQHLIHKHKYGSYLEIGVRDRETLSQINLPVVHGVDPNGQGDYAMTSDEFFAGYCKQNYDIVFVDGLHLREQTLKDIDNALLYLNTGGSIVVHDCLPEEEWHQYRECVPCKPWNGDVWKAWADLRSSRSDLYMYVVDTDWGCGVIQRGSQETIDRPDGGWTWQHFQDNRNKLMNIVSVEDFLGYSQP